MNRRELFVKAAPLALVPFVKLNLRGKEFEAIESKPRKFLIFFNAQTIDIESFLHERIPGWDDVDALFIPMHLKNGETVSDALQLVEQFEEVKNG